MVANIVEVVKGTGSSKGFQTQKSKKTASDEKSAFGQALTDAAGAANSANAQPERQTYDQNQKDTSVAEKGAEGIQAAPNDPKQQAVPVQEGAEGQTALTSLMQMGAEGVQTADPAKALMGQSIVGTEQNADEILMTAGVQAADGVRMTNEAQMTDTAQTTAGEIPIDSLKNVSSGTETFAESKELPASAAVKDDQPNPEMSEQMMSANTDKKTAGLEGVRDDENNIIDVKAEAASDKAGTSFIQRQSMNDSGVVEARVEVTETGEIKPEYANMLKDMIAKQLSSGRQELEISLTPRNLGALIVKVAVEAGETTVSIICSNAKTMEAMSSKASELGRMLETTLGDKMEVMVEDKNSQDSRFYDEGRNDSGAQAQKDEQERRHEENRRRMELEAGSADFLQQLRLGLA